MLSDRIDFTGRQARVDQHRPCIHGSRGQKRRNQSTAVVRNQHDPIPRPDAGLEQPSPRFSDSLGELSIRTAATCLYQRELIGRGVSPRLDDVADSFGEFA